MKELIIVGVVIVGILGLIASVSIYACIKINNK